MSCMSNPKDEFKGKRLVRGLVIGDVQSGKTATYSGLICKAVDAGYKVVILLAGITENLRQQTQERIDEGIVGLAIKRNPITKKDDVSRVGVGKYQKALKASSYTSQSLDFIGENGLEYLWDEVWKANGYEDIEDYAKRENVPIMLPDGIDYLCNYIKEHNIKKILEIGSAIDNTLMIGVYQQIALRHLAVVNFLQLHCHRAGIHMVVQPILKQHQIPPGQCPDILLRNSLQRPFRCRRCGQQSRNRP